MFYTTKDNADFFTCAGQYPERNEYSDVADKKLLELDQEKALKSGVKEPKSLSTQGKTMLYPEVHSGNLSLGNGKKILTGI